MKTIIKTLLAANIGVAALLAATSANAAIVINFSQVGANVVVTATGTFDKSLATSVGGSGSIGQTISPGAQFFGLGTQGSTTFYQSTGPTFLTTSASTSFNSTSGTTMFLNQSANIYGIATNYVSNTLIAATGTILGKTLANIGAVNGSYVQTVGGNTVTVNIGQAVAAVPETATWGMMIAGFGMMGASMRYRRRTAKVAFA